MSKAADIVLRVGVAFAFLYPPFSAISDPASWLGYFPPFVLGLSHSLGVPDLVLLHGFGVFEVALALWILSGWRVQYPAALAAAVLAAIVILDFNNLEVLFRDVSIGLAAAALAINHFKKSV